MRKHIQSCVLKGVHLLLHDTYTGDWCALRHDLVHGTQCGSKNQVKKGQEKVFMFLQIRSQGVKGYKTANLTSNTSKNDCLLSERLKKQSNWISRTGYWLSCNYLPVYKAKLSRRAFKCLRSCRKKAQETLIFLQSKKGNPNQTCQNITF